MSLQATNKRGKQQKLIIRIYKISLFLFMKQTLAQKTSYFPILMHIYININVSNHLNWVTWNINRLVLLTMVSSENNYAFFRGLDEIRAHDLCDYGENPLPLSWKARWELAGAIVSSIIPVK